MPHTYLSIVSPLSFRKFIRDARSICVYIEYGYISATRVTKIKILISGS